MNLPALVLFSGEHDSASCLAWALEKYNVVETIGFDYGQRHAIELDCRDNTLKALQVAMNLCLDSPMVVQVPRMWIDKAQTWRMAQATGKEALIEIILEYTHTC